MVRRPPRSTQSRSSAASDVYKRQQDLQSRPRSGWRSRTRPHWSCARTTRKQKQAVPATIPIPICSFWRSLRLSLITWRVPFCGPPRSILLCVRSKWKPLKVQIYDCFYPSGGKHAVLWPICPVSYTHLRAHETRHDLVCRLLLEKKNIQKQITYAILYM